jgi:Tfp pilus assembly protein PilF
VDAAASAPRLDAAKYRKAGLGLYPQAREAAPRDPVYLTRLAWVLRRLDEPGRAGVLLREALRINPNYGDAQLQLAEALYESGQYAEAEQAFDAYLRRSRGR